MNPFIICNTALIEELRAYADQEKWIAQCRLLGATMDQLMTYDATARAYARTTPYPNSDVIRFARKVALEVLVRGEPMPTDAKATIEAEERRVLAALLDPDKRAPDLATLADIARRFSRRTEHMNLPEPEIIARRVLASNAPDLVSAVADALRAYGAACAAVERERICAYLEAEYFGVGTHDTVRAVIAALRAG